MEWGEAIRLIRILQADSSTQFAAALQGWEFPITREALATLDVFDLLHQVNAKRKPKPHPGRPVQPSSAERMGDVKGRTSNEVRDLLTRARNGTAPI